jgi:hypothetical protein
MHKPDYTVLVDLKDDNAQPEYYILPTLELDRELDDIFQRWLVAKPERAKPHNPANRMRRIGDSEYQQKWLARWKGVWALILGQLEA